MTRIQFIVFLVLASLCVLSWAKKPSKKAPVPKFKVTGTIMQTASYCGGTRPTEELLVKARTPVGIPFGRLFIRSKAANTNTVTGFELIQADENGNFSVNLTAGNYCLVEAWKTKQFTLPLNSKVQTVDSACYRKLYDSCDYELIISDKSISDIKIVFHRPCFYNLPCINYKGPMPH